MRRGILSAAVLCVLVGAGPAHADSVVHSSGIQFLPPVVPLDQGGSLTYTIADVAPHNLVADDRGPTGQPLFSSGAPTGNGAYPVAGVEDLAPGTYTFHCDLHGNMTGELQVLEQSAPPIPDPPDPPGGVTTPTGVVPTPTSLTAFDGAMYVASWQGGTVQRLPIMDGGLLGQPSTYADGFSSPLGVAFAPDGTLFVADSHPSSTPGRSTDGRVWAVAPGGGSKDIVVDGLPNGRHNTNGMEVRNGRLYIANGNSTDDGVAGGDPETPLSGTLLSVPVGARGLTASSPELVLEARGMRNLYDVAFRPGTSEAWLPMNGPDALDPWGEDLLLKADVDATRTVTTTTTKRKKRTTSVVEDVVADFGFPGCVYAAPPNEPAVKQNPAVADTHPCNPAAITAPEQLLGLHVSADGLAFGPQDDFWSGDLFIAEFGSFFGTTPTGHQIVRVPIDDAGQAGPPEAFLPGGTPLDVTFGPPGTGLYIADFGSGQILLVKGSA